MVSWCFKLSKPQKIILELRETFIKRCVVESTNKEMERESERERKRERETEGGREREGETD